MDAFFGITILFFIIVYFLKRMPDVEDKERPNNKSDISSVFPSEDAKTQELIAEAKRRRDKDIKELKKQGFDDELIAVILPTINNGQ